jgi:microsomal dipeptidase-like Zn-dependent dipeptidase
MVDDPCMTSEKLLQIPCELSKATTMAHRSLRIVFDSQEELTDEQLQKIMSCHGKIGWVVFLPEERPIDALDVAGLPPIQWEEEGSKSPAQRMRAVIYRLWEQGGKVGDFNEVYKSRMEKLIDLLKEKLT